MTYTPVELAKATIANPSCPTPQTARPRLTAQWDIINGKLVCRWLLT